VRRSVLGVERALKVLSAAKVAAIGDFSRDVGIDGTDYGEITGVSSNQPDQHENSKSNVAR